MNSKFFKKALCLVAFFGIANNISIAMENSANDLFESNFTFGKKGLNNYSKSKSDNINEYDLNLNGFYDVGEEAGNNVHNLQKQIFGMQQKTYELKDKFDKICKSDDYKQIKQFCIDLKKVKENYNHLTEKFNKYKEKIKRKQEEIENFPDNKEVNKEEYTKKLIEEVVNFNEHEQKNEYLLSDINRTLNNLKKSVKSKMQQETDKLYYSREKLYKEFYLKYNKSYDIIEKYIKEAKKITIEKNDPNKKQKIQELINNVQNYIRNGKNDEQIVQLGKDILEILNYNANFSDGELSNVLKYLEEEKNRLEENSIEYINKNSIINKQLKGFEDLYKKILQKDEENSEDYIFDYSDYE